MATIFLAITCRKPTEHIFECLHSVIQQTHNNWLAHVTIDDAASADPHIVGELMTYANPRITITSVPDRLYALKNQLNAIDTHCPHDAIVGKLDGDDMLAGPSALKAVSDAYDTDPELDVLWTKFISTGRPCCCKDLPAHLDPLEAGWVTSHFQTFRKRVLWGVRREAFIDPELGTEWRCSCDHALYLPLLLHARKRKFLPQICYRYRRGEGDNASEEQKCTAQRIREHNKALRSSAGKKNVLFIVNGPGASHDKRFYNGERRPPLGVLSMAAHLRARGHGVTLVDRFLSPGWDPKPETVEQADMVGVYVSTPNGLDARDMIRRVRSQHPKKLIVAGGPHAILWPEQVLGWGADLTYGGEADFAISRIVETGTIPQYPKRITDLNTLPFPAYDLLKEQGILEKYSAGWPFSKAAGVMTLNTSRGCPFGCAFCDVKSVWGRAYHAMSAERIMLDIAELRRYGARAFYFREDNFCCDPRRLQAVCSLMPKGVSWACEMRADLGCKEPIVAMMAKAGCAGYYIGAESGSDRVLKLMNKGITAAQIEATCANARKHGIAVALSMITGYPGEEAADKEATAQMLKRSPAKHVWKAPYRKPWGQYESSPIGE